MRSQKPYVKDWENMKNGVGDGFHSHVSSSAGETTALALSSDHTTTEMKRKKKDASLSPDKSK